MGLLPPSWRARGDTLQNRELVLDVIMQRVPATIQL